MNKFMLSILGVLCMCAVFVAPAQGATLFGLVDAGMLFVSGDGGTSWEIRATITVPDAVAIAATTTTDDLLMATRSGSVYQSTDAGVSWVAVGSVSSSDVADMLVLGTGDVLLLTERGTLWVSSDGGGSFNVLATLTASDVVSLATDDVGRLYALTRSGEVSRSADTGVTWNVVGVMTAPDAVEIIGVGSDLFVLTEKGDVARSTDQGVTWLYVGTVSHVEMQALTVESGDLVAASSKGLVARSADGTSWGFIGSINQVSVLAIGNDTPCVTGMGPDVPPGASRLVFLSVWPNPVDPVHQPLRLRFYLPEPGWVAADLYDASGRRVAHKPARFFDRRGERVLPWEIGEIRSGVYFARLRDIRGSAACQKVVVVK